MQATETISSQSLLPAGFEDLNPFLAEWNLATEQERCAKRLSMTLPQLRIFYDAILPRMDAVMGHLAGFPADDLASLSPGTRNLYHLALSYFEASHPIELKWDGIDLRDAFPADRIVYMNPSNQEN